MVRKYENRKFLKPSTLRPLAKGLVALAVAVGLVVAGGWGTYSSFGPTTISTICPLGAFESLFGAWAFVPRLVIAAVVVCLIVFVAGRAFCGWICPVPPISRFLTSKKRREQDAQACEQAGCTAFARWRARRAGEGGAAGGTADAGAVAAGCAAGEGAVAAARSATEPDSGPAGEDAASSAAVVAAGGSVGETKASLDSRHVVLLGALGSAAVFGFPVFCLVCPIGLTVGTAVLFVRLVGYNEPSWGLVVFPVVLILELVLARDFCGKLCPMAALMSLITRGNRTFRPHADTSKCLRTTAGASCHVCSSTCPGHIDPQSNLGLAAVNECTRCARCAEACPAGAISFPLLKPKEDEAHADGSQPNS